MKNLAVAFLLAFAAACASSGKEQPAPPSGAAGNTVDLARARALLDAGETDEALLITDRLLRENRRDRDALLVAARANVALFESGRSGQQAFLQDAIACVEGALDVQRQDPQGLLLLADLYLKDSRFAIGRDTALEAAGLLKAANAPPAAQARAVLLAADNELQTFADARRREIAASEDPSEATVRLANAVLSRLEWARQVAPGAAAQKAGLVYQWLGKDAEALAEMERGLSADPGNAELNLAYQAAHERLDRRAECVAAYKRLLRSQPDNAILLWYLGRAQVAHADALRAKSQWDAAGSAYAQASETYGRYQVLAPQHGDAVNQWLAICWLSRGRMAIERGDLEQARAAYDQAFAADARVAEQDQNGRPLITDDFGHFYAGGLDLIGRAITDASTPKALADGLAHYERIIGRHPGRFGFVYNNAALCARDLGVAIERAAREEQDQAKAQAQLKEALALWEKSYAFYEKAVELEPEDPRIVNDCGLMLVYHLHRDYERARELFDAAIAIGERQLAELSEDTPEDARHSLEEAVGDAYQNIAVLMRAQEKAFDDYEPFLRKAVAFYPYQQRQAALLLRTRGRSELAPTRTAAQGAAVRAERTAQQAAFDEVKAQAEAKANADDLDGALLVLDAAAKQFKDHAAYLALVGSYSLRYANRSREAGGSSLQVDGLYSDAVRNLERAVELDPSAIGPRIELAQARYDHGDFEAAAAGAEDLLSSFRSSGGGEPEHIRRAHELRALATTRVYIARKQAGADDAETLRAARTSYRELEKLGAPTKTLETWSMLEQWAGAPDQAFEVWLRQAQRNADSLADVAVLQQLVELGGKAGRSAQLVELLGAQQNAAARWFLGRAHFNRADAALLDGEPAAALTELQAAFHAFASAKAANPDYAESSTQWQALCLGKRGIVLQGQGDDEAALAALFEGARLAPDQFTQSLGGGFTIKQGLLVVADKFYRKGELGKVEEIYRQAAEIAPTDPDLANNHGLMARDYGVQLEKEGKATEAKRMYEASYAAYSRAATLEPDSIRLVNDRALLLIYHLQRDWELAVQLLEEGIAQGEARLRDDPPQDEQQRADLEESVGDCYQNRGYYHLVKTKDRAKARADFEKSLTFRPFQQRASARHLRDMGREEKGQDGGK
jgi:tetratricopeptide (TPR) repeat protein